MRILFYKFLASLVGLSILAAAATAGERKFTVTNKTTPQFTVVNNSVTVPAAPAPATPTLAPGQLRTHDGWIIENRNGQWFRVTPSQAAPEVAAKPPFVRQAGYSTIPTTGVPPASTSLPLAPERGSSPALIPMAPTFTLAPSAGRRGSTSYQQCTTSG